MGHSTGKYLPITPYRRNVVDLMHFSQKIPSVAADRRMDLSPLIAARAASVPRPSWCVIFSKAFGMLGRDYPELRRSYMKFPWPHFYEHPYSKVSLNVERATSAENIVIFCLIRAPENRTLAEMDAIVKHHKDAPLESLRSYQRSRDIARIPWPFRRLFWAASLNVAGRRRCHNFGTFGISSIASQGAGLLNLIPVLTTALHYGLFDDAGRLDVRLTWDHRVMDGATIGRVLTDLEATLNREIVRELSVVTRRAA